MQLICWAQAWKHLFAAWNAVLAFERRAGECKPSCGFDGRKSQTGTELWPGGCLPTFSLKEAVVSTGVPVSSGFGGRQAKLVAGSGRASFGG